MAENPNTHALSSSVSDYQHHHPELVKLLAQQQQQSAAAVSGQFKTTTKIEIAADRDGSGSSFQRYGFQAHHASQQQQQQHDVDVQLHLLDTQSIPTSVAPFYPNPAATGPNFDWSPSAGGLLFNAASAPVANQSLLTASSLSTNAASVHSTFANQAIAATSGFEAAATAAASTASAPQQHQQQYQQHPVSVTSTNIDVEQQSQQQQFYNVAAADLQRYNSACAVSDVSQTLPYAAFDTNVHAHAYIRGGGAGTAAYNLAPHVDTRMLADVGDFNAVGYGVTEPTAQSAWSAWTQAAAVRRNSLGVANDMLDAQTIGFAGCYPPTTAAAASVLQPQQHQVQLQSTPWSHTDTTTVVSSRIVGDPFENTGPAPTVLERIVRPIAITLSCTTTSTMPPPITSVAVVRRPSNRTTASGLVGAFECQLCGKRYARKSSLNLHLRQHNPKPFSCEHCGKLFTQAANLVAHLRVHTGEKPFTCNICARPFSQSSSLATHRRTHTGEKPYPCLHCPKRFADSSTLAKHVRTHTGVKPYECAVCTQRFSQSGNLHRHQRVHVNKAVDVEPFV